MNTLILSGGDIDLTFLKKYLNDFTFDMVIAVDKGFESLIKLEIFPNHIVGDFDSVSKEILAYYSDIPNVIIHTYEPEKDNTDTDIALQLAISLCSDAITILGGTGSRLDHTLANIHILLSALEKNIPCKLVDPNNSIELIQKEYILSPENAFGKYVSLIPFTSEVTGVSLINFKYPLLNHTLKIGESLGISNEIIAFPAKILSNNGILILIQSQD